MNAGVHDSYWTHACDVDEMNKILREKFVELYETPILENVFLYFSNCIIASVQEELKIIKWVTVYQEKMPASFLGW